MPVPLGLETVIDNSPSLIIAYPPLPLCGLIPITINPLLVAVYGSDTHSFVDRFTSLFCILEDAI